MAGTIAQLGFGSRLTGEHNIENPMSEINDQAIKKIEHSSRIWRKMVIDMDDRLILEPLHVLR